MTSPDRITFREAQEADLPEIVEMLANDPLGKEREDASGASADAYLQAFRAIDVDPHNELLVACDAEEVIGVLQLTFIPNLSYRGSWRCLIEGVRVAEGYRGQRIGRRLIEQGINRARNRKCRWVQLTTNKSRAAAIAFYEGLGFKATHEGMKLELQAEETA